MEKREKYRVVRTIVNRVARFLLLPRFFPPKRRNRGNICATIFLAVATGIAPLAEGEDTSVTKLPAGTIVGENPPDNWTDTLFISIPKVSEGDVEKVSTMVASLAEMLSLVEVARVEVEPSSTTNGIGPKYRLGDVGVGLAVRRGDTFVVVSGAADTPSADNRPKLDFIQNQVVASASKSLDDMRIIARRTTLILFDSPAVVRQNNENMDLILRTLVWVEASTGKLGKLIWLLKPGDQDSNIQELALDEICFLPPGFKGAPGLYVDSELFTFGVPSSRAFALTRLPNGRKVQLQGDLATLAGQKEYSTQQLGMLVAGLSAALKSNANQPAVRNR